MPLPAESGGTKQETDGKGLYGRDHSRYEKIPPNPEKLYTGYGLVCKCDELNKIYSKMGQKG